MADLVELAERCERGDDVQWLTSEIDDLTRALVGSSWTMNDWGLVNDAIRKNSLDAVAALLERVLPGWHGNVELGSMLRADKTYSAVLVDPTENPDRFTQAEATSPARALLAAILRALSDKGRG